MLQMMKRFCRISGSTGAGVLLLSPAVSLGHGKESHHGPMEERAAVHASHDQAIEPSMHEIHHEINRKYRATIKPILTKSCANCHASETQFPWYYSVPGIKQLIDRDISEAKRHLDLSHDFPFGGHGSHAEDIKAIGEAVTKRSMPPWSYRLMHPESEIGPEAEKEILTWVKESLFVIGRLSERKSHHDER